MAAQAISNFQLARHLKNEGTWTMAMAKSVSHMEGQVAAPSNPKVTVPFAQDGVEILYQLPNGKLIHHAFLGTGYGYRAGDSIRIAYLPNVPEKFLLSDEVERAGTEFSFQLFVSCLFMTGGMAFFHYGRRSIRKNNRDVPE